jgi:hypothetical protein
MGRFVMFHCQYRDLWAALNFRRARRRMASRIWLRRWNATQPGRLEAIGIGGARGGSSTTFAAVHTMVGLRLRCGNSTAHWRYHWPSTLSLGARTVTHKFLKRGFRGIAASGVAITSPRGSDGDADTGLWSMTCGNARALARSSTDKP